MLLLPSFPATCLRLSPTPRVAQHRQQMQRWWQLGQGHRLRAQRAWQARTCSCWWALCDALIPALLTTTTWIGRQRLHSWPVALFHQD